MHAYIYIYIYIYIDRERGYLKEPETTYPADLQDNSDKREFAQTTLKHTHTHIYIYIYIYI